MKKYIILLFLVLSTRGFAMQGGYATLVPVGQEGFLAEKSNKNKIEKNFHLTLSLKEAANRQKCILTTKKELAFLVTVLESQKVKRVKSLKKELERNKEYYKNVSPYEVAAIMEYLTYIVPAKDWYDLYTQNYKVDGDNTIYNKITIKGLPGQELTLEGQIAQCMFGFKVLSSLIASCQACVRTDNCIHLYAQSALDRKTHDLLKHGLEAAKFPCVEVCKRALENK